MSKFKPCDACRSPRLCERNEWCEKKEVHIATQKPADSDPYAFDVVALEVANVYLRSN